MVAKLLDDNKPRKSLKKYMRTVSNFIDLIQFHLICQMLAKCSGYFESERTISKFRKRKRRFCVVFTYSIKWVHETRGGALGYFLGGYVLPGTPNWHPVLKKLSAKIDTPFQKWAKFLYPFLEFALKLIPRSRNGPNFYIPFQKVCKLKQPRFLKKIFLYLFDSYIK